MYSRAIFESAPSLRELLAGVDKIRGLILEQMVLENANKALAMEVNRLRDPGGPSAVPASPEPAPFPVAAGVEPASGGPGAEPPVRRTRPAYCTSCFRWNKDCYPEVDMASSCEFFDRPVVLGGES